MTRPIASLSLDLDNVWAYLKTNGDPGWQTFPGYFDLVVPRILEMLDRHGLRITFFVVGQDAARAENAAALRSIAQAGHEIANHSFHHEPWIAMRPPAEIDAELAATEDALLAATGQRPVGFRGPSFALSADLLDVLAARGYRYDASTFPSVLGPLARAYYFANARIDRDGRRQRQAMFGSFTDGLRPLRPYRWATTARPVIELPVTTWPGLRVPIHLTYVMFLAARSPALARTYFATALTACRVAGVAPSILLHPTEFLGADDTDRLAFFPGMGLAAEVKLAVLDAALTRLAASFRVVTMCEHADLAEATGRLSVRNVPAGGTGKSFDGKVPSHA
ncbi:MAG: polysaccharide deacetylase family protein [Hyphomicrobiaceae bacterium]|nr:polysaccharide deacetylase family protein [Hyphomicrobiaceae bacterium]